MSTDPTAAKRHRTQWAAQFAVASELVKRGHEVALTMGNRTPLADLMVINPHGEQFLVDVKGQMTPGRWPVRTKTVRKNLWFILAEVPVGAPNTFHILHSSEVARLNEETPSAGRGWHNKIGGFNRSQLRPEWTDAWDRFLDPLNPAKETEPAPVGGRAPKQLS